MSNKSIVAIKDGKVQGIRQKSKFSGTEYYSFFGIPYAQPPEGRLRFRDPVKVKPWKEVYDATQEKEGCAQFSIMLQRYMGSEDCLHNNIHTCKLPSKGEPLKPVIVLIHPGAHAFGDANSTQFGSPNFFIHHDIVYVGIAYRLHVFGFLNLGLEECSGNQGVKDIVLALRWIKENIHFFNGDPDNVTLLGSSSASAIVHTLMLSPQAEGLFHKAVMMGMIMFANLICVEECRKETGLEFARGLGFEGDDPKKLLVFLRKLPAMMIVNHFRTFRTCQPNVAPIYPIMPFQPQETDDEDGIVPNLRKRIPFTMKVPLMFGLCENETFMGFTTKRLPYTKKNFRKSYRQNAVWGWMRNLTDDELDKINDQIDSFYLKDCSKDNIPIPILINILTDATFSELYDALIDIISSELPDSVYVYKFEYDGHMTPLKNVVLKELEHQLKGSYHGADFAYWAYGWDPKTSETVKVIEKFTKLICTFAREGHPNYEGIEEQWRPTTPQHQCHMKINTTLRMANGKLNHEGMEFWSKIMEQFKKD